jgi:hypothetical protein
MKVRLFKDSDHEMVAKWWKVAGAPVVALSQLQTMGLIGYTSDDEPACAMWVYKSEGVAVAFLEHLVTNPEVTSPMKKMRAVQFMMDFMLEQLYMDGFQMIRGITWSDTLAKICQRRWGFQLIDDNAKNLALILK